MRILYCNKYNYPFSGTEAYLFEAMELMRSRGHETALFSMADPRGKPTPYDRHFMPYTDFKKQSGWFHKAELWASAIYSIEARRKMRAMIAEFRPDVAHVRNIYHHLSPSILWELKAQRIPVVYHLNDFKVLCPSYNLVSHGEACEACKGGRFWQTLKQECYPGTAARTALVVEAYFHKWIGTYRKCVYRFLAPSQFVRDKFVEHGWDAEKFEVLPHFQAVKRAQERGAEKAPLLYFGRLSREKGVDDLLRAMHQLPHLQLVVAGDGPERENLRQLGNALGLANVEFTGYLRGAELDRAIAKSSFTVLPSHAYETLGKTILESYAHARTVIGSDMGSRRELIRQSETGLLYKTGDVAELASAIELLSNWPQLADEMGQAGQELVRQRYSPEAHYEALIDLYERMAGQRKQSSVESKSASAAEITLPAVREEPACDASAGDGLVGMSLLGLTEARRDRGSSNLTASQKKVLRIAFIGGRGLISKYSGIETYYEEVGTRLAAMGHEVTAYCRSGFTPPVREYKGIRVVRLPTIRSKHLETLLHTLLSTLDVLVRPCDVVHYHALGPALFSFIPRLAGKKTVVTVQGLDWQRKKWGRIASAVLRVGERAAARLPNRTIVVSRTLQQHYWEKYGSKTFYVPNGGSLRELRVPDKIFNCGLETGNYILYLGRFSPEKRCHLLVEAYERLETDAKLVLAGASSYCDDYERELRSHASERIKILDWVAGVDLDELLTNAMLFVLPSVLEGLSLALLDAMGAGVCVLTSDVPENREAVEDAGFTFPRGDVAGLADRMQFLIANPVVREAAGAAARRRIRDHYQWSSVAAEVERVYFDIMERDSVEAVVRKSSGRVTAPARDSRQKAG
ncbi:MAG: glycosyltransferase family 4 protein [Candidatus Sulfotelmatobacter sp.]